jgi:hypothetical protein
LAGRQSFFFQTDFILADFTTKNKGSREIVSVLEYWNVQITKKLAIAKKFIICMVGMAAYPTTQKHPCG